MVRVIRFISFYLLNKFLDPPSACYGYEFPADAKCYDAWNHCGLTGEAQERHYTDGSPPISTFLQVGPVMSARLTIVHRKNDPQWTPGRLRSRNRLSCLSLCLELNGSCESPYTSHPWSVYGLILRIIYVGFLDPCRQLLEMRLTVYCSTKRQQRRFSLPPQ